MEIYLSYFGYGCFLLGSFFMVTSGVGILRMPDFFSRLHPAGISDSIGLPLILLGILFNTEFGLITAKIVFIIVFSMLTSSTACHALSKSAWLSGQEPLGKTIERKKKKIVKKIVKKKADKK